jgi:secondary thiamine-phosphate synthase enzyme
MGVTSKTLTLRTRGEGDMQDLTEAVGGVVGASGLTRGIATVFVVGSTAALTTIEYEPGLVRDFPAMLDRLIPKAVDYEHQRRWHDDNGHSHVRAALVGPSLTVPFREGRLTLGTWQQIVLVELDIRARNREVIVQLLGE